MEAGLVIPEGSEFGLANVPFGVMATKDNHAFCATRFGDFAVDLAQAEAKGLFDGPLWKKHVFQHPTLNAFMSLTRQHWKWARQRLQHAAKQNKNLTIHKISELSPRLPCVIGDYTDFYSSRDHAYNVGCIIRGPDNAMQENWFHLPVGYHGRSSSVVVSGHDLRRPRGQTKAPDAKVPSFTACKRLDFQIEVGAFLGGPLNQLGTPIKVNQASKYIFGLVILNDWSARDLQTWEYVPLGPFTAKNCMTSISPWIITCQALQPYRVGLDPQMPEPLPYLREKEHSSYDLRLELTINGTKFVQTNFRHLYWSISQQLTHHAVTGCNMRPGDLLGSGTISGPTKQSRGSMLELSWGGKQPYIGKTFLEDGDEVVIQGLCQREGVEKVGFGQVRGKVLPALSQEHFI